MNILPSLCLLCLPFFSVFSGFPQRAAAAGSAAADVAKLEEIRRKSLAQLQLLRAIECTMVYEMHAKMGGAAYPAGERWRAGVTAVEGRLVVIQAGDKYRMETERTNLKTKVTTTYIAVYDGNRHQIFAKDKKVLDIKDRAILSNPSQALGPINAVYGWVLDKRVERTLGQMQNEKYWLERFAMARYCGQREKGGTVVEVVEFPYPYPDRLPEQDAVLRVRFSVDHGYYPISNSVRCADGRIISQSRVDKCKRIEIEGQHVIVPLKKSLEFNVPGAYRVEEQSSVLPETIKVNHRIDEDIFTIPVTRARKVQDLDSSGRVENPAVPGLSSRSGLRAWLIAVVISLFALLSLLGWLIWESRHASD